MGGAANGQGWRLRWVLLDLGKPNMVVGRTMGSLVVYLNGERLGVMVREGITPPVRWAVDLGYGASARLESQPAPRPERLYI